MIEPNSGLKTGQALEAVEVENLSMYDSKSIQLAILHK